MDLMVSNVSKRRFVRPHNWNMMKIILKKVQKVLQKKYCVQFLGSLTFNSVICCYFCIIRTLFYSFPSVKLHSNDQHADNKYDMTLDNIQSVDCTQIYPKCSTSIWSSDFVF